MTTMKKIIINVSIKRDLIPFFEPGSPIDSTNRWANGKKINRDKFENKKIKFQSPCKNKINKNLKKKKRHFYHARVKNLAISNICFEELF